MPVLTSSVIITTVTVFVIGSALKAAFAWTRLPRLQLKARRAFEKGDFRKAAQLAEEAFKLSVESHASPAAKQSAENQFNAYMIAAYGQYGAMGVR